MQKIYNRVFLSKKNIYLFSLSLVGLLISAILIYLLGVEKYYPHNLDEILLKRVIEGATNGGDAPFSPVPYMVYINYILGLILSLFYLIIPKAPWYFLMLVSVTVFAYTAILYRVLILCRSNYKKVIIGSIAFMILFLLCNYAIRIMYTEIAGLCTGAAVFYCICMNFDGSKKEKIFDTVILCMLTTFSMCIRDQMGYITFAVLIGVFLYKFLIEKIGIVKMYKVFVPVLCCLLIPFIVQTIVKNSSYYKEHTNYNQIRTEFFDYYGMPEWETDKEFYDSIGMDYDAYIIAKNCTYIFDDVINEEQMKAIVDYQKEKLAAQGFSGKIKTIAENMFSKSKHIYFTRSAYIILIFTIIFIAITVIRKEYSRLILILMISFLSLVMYVYLCYGGRVLDRAVRPIFFIELLTILYLLLTEDFTFILNVKGRFGRFIGYGITVGLILFTLPGTAINFLEDRGEYKVYKTEALKYEATREYILTNNKTNFIIGIGLIANEPLLLSNNNLSVINYVGRATWELHSPHIYKLYENWGVSEEITIEKICDKNIAYMVHKGRDYQKAFVSFVDNHYPTMKVIEVDTITDGAGEAVGVYKVVSK